MGIVILGGTGVGKSTVGAVISQRIGYPLYEVGHVVKQIYVEEMVKLQENPLLSMQIAISELNQLAIKNGKQDLTQKRLEFTREIVKKEGSDYFVRVLMERYPEDRKIIVGVRSFTEIAAIDCRMKHPFYVGLMCSEDRLLNRFTNREKAYMNENVAKEIFVKRYDIEHAWGVDSVMNKCNLVLETDNYSPEDLADYIIKCYGVFLEGRDNV